MWRTICLQQETIAAKIPCCAKCFCGKSVLRRQFPCGGNVAAGLACPLVVSAAQRAVLARGGHSTVRLGRAQYRTGWGATVWYIPAGHGTVQRRRAHDGRAGFVRLLYVAWACLRACMGWYVYPRCSLLGRVVPWFAKRRMAAISAQQAQNHRGQPKRVPKTIPKGNHHRQG